MARNAPGTIARGVGNTHGHSLWFGGAKPTLPVRVLPGGGVGGSTPKPLDADELLPPEERRRWCTKCCASGPAAAMGGPLKWLPWDDAVSGVRVLSR